MYIARFASTGEYSWFSTIWSTLVAGLASYSPYSWGHLASPNSVGIILLNSPLQRIWSQPVLFTRVRLTPVQEFLKGAKPITTTQTSGPFDIGGGKLLGESMLLSLYTNLCMLRNPFVQLQNQGNCNPLSYLLQVNVILKEATYCHEVWRIEPH